MKFFKGLLSAVTMVAFIFSGSVLKAGGQDYSSSGEDTNKKILKQGLVGAGVGAISASASGGKAGKGALIGAGTNVLGNALVDTLTNSPAPRPQAQPVYAQQQAPQYVQQAPVQTSYPVQTQGYQRVEPQPVYVQQAPAYYPPQEDSSKRILKQGLVGAGVGAISASASGGKAGKGALIGAGTNVLGNALLDTLTGSSQPQPQPQPVYYQQAPPTYQQQGYATNQPKKKIVRHYDADGNVVSEEEVWE